MPILRGQTKHQQEVKVETTAIQLTFADRQGSVAWAAQRIEHPHLTGMCLLHVLLMVYQTYQ